MKALSVLGSTGSIGTQTLDVVKKNPEKLCIKALAAGRDVNALAKQAREFQVKLVCIGDENKYSELSSLLSDTNIRVTCGMDGLCEVAAYEETDVTVTAIVGMIGIRPTIDAIKAGKDIALANKETLVTAGHIIMPLTKEYNVKLLPVDSEHSAIFQCLQGEDSTRITKLYLTASGGPFRGYDFESLKNVTPEMALKHPNWSMGQKITIDSATMVNKGLEIIEAHWLFGMDGDDIKAVVHPQSIIHSMVEFADGSVKAQLGTPDMRIPIRYALFYPDRPPSDSERLDFYKISRLDFEEPDLKVFKGLQYAYEAMKKGGNMPVIYNAANEAAVSRFLSGKISFTGIYEMIEKAMSEIRFINEPDINGVLSTEAEVYELFS